MAAALRNITLSDENKRAIMKESAIVDVMAKLARDPDDEVSHQACGIIANIAEAGDNKLLLVEQGIVHHLQFSMLSKQSTPVLRESIRAFANLSSARENTAVIVSSGALGRLIDALDSADVLSRRFAAMTLSNLAFSDESKARIVREGALSSLVRIVEQTDIDKETQQHAMACLANLASCHELQPDLLNCGCAELAMVYLKSSNLDMRTNALLCISNFASTSASHSKLRANARLVYQVVENLGCNDRLVRLRAVTSLRGLSTDPSYRECIISSGGVEPLLSFVHLDDTEIKVEVLTTLCNLSLGGCMADGANTLLQTVDMKSLICFLCNSDSTHRLFGAVAIGNIASHIDLQAPVLDSGALQPLIGLSEEHGADVESQRCMSYAICNLSADLPNRMAIIRAGGLPSIMYLCRTGDTADMLAALSTLRGLAASAEARRAIVEEGVLSVLALASKTGSVKCKQEVAAIMVLLSLNEENKFDIVRSDEMEEIVKLADMEDALCVSQLCRAMGNISEVSELHSDILRVFSVERLVRLGSHSDPAVTLEVSRCYANLSSNFDIHASLLESSQFIESIVSLLLVSVV